MISALNLVVSSRRGHVSGASLCVCVSVCVCVCVCVCVKVWK